MLAAASCNRARPPVTNATQEDRDRQYHKYWAPSLQFGRNYASPNATGILLDNVDNSEGRFLRCGFHSQSKNAGGYGIRVRTFAAVTVRRND